MWRRGVSSDDNNAADPQRHKRKIVIVTNRGNRLFCPIECERNFYKKLYLKEKVFN